MPKTIVIFAVVGAFYVGTLVADGIQLVSQHYEIQSLPVPAPKDEDRCRGQIKRTVSSLLTQEMPA